MPDGLLPDRELAPPNGGAAESRVGQTVQVDGERPTLPHITDRFIPISHIVTALARTAYSDLGRLRSSIIDATDQKRKKRIVDYASKYRAEVVKVMVLVNWAARADEVSTAIDLRAWLQGQRNCFDNLYSLLRFDILKDLEGAKLVGPDIPAAIEVLTTGSILRLRSTALTKQFQTPIPMTVPEIVRTLHSMDALLSLRLLLHETLPSAMQKYTVASGRVTFEVTNEFSVDLFFATEDIDSPELLWFMIDFRFAFTEDDYIDTPMSLKLDVENIANALMAKSLADGRAKQQLVELYNFLHSFTIQYRLERLFSQFSTIGSREKGRIDVKYASAQKVLAVGYWLQKRHRDTKSVLNSMTITIESNATRAGDHFLTSERITNNFNREKLKIVVRYGEVEQSIGSINVEERSATTLLSDIVQNRTGHLLNELCRELDNSELPFTIGRSKVLGSSLRIELVQDEHLIISVDEYNGNFLASLDVSGRQEHDFKVIKAVETLQVALNVIQKPRDQAIRIHDFKFNHLKKGIEEVAQTASWACPTFVATSLNLDEFGTAFGNANKLISPSSCLFLTRPQEGWKDTEGGSSWFVVITVQPSALRFWVAEFVVDNKMFKWQVQWVERLALGDGRDSVSLHYSLDTAFFDRLWRLCTARLISLQLSRGMGDRNIDHRYVQNSAEPCWTSINVPNITFAVDEISRAGQSWAEPSVTVELLHLCSDASGGAIVSFVCQRSADQDLDLTPFDDVEIHAHSDSRRISFNFKAFVAQTSNVIVDQFCRKWRMVENTLGMLASVSKLSETFVIQQVRLNVANFLYGTSFVLQIQQQPSLLDGPVQLGVTLGSLTHRSNPHRRIAKYLSPIATKYQGTISVLFKLIKMTFPVLETLDRIEQENYTNPEFYIVVRSAETYRIYYARKAVTLLIRARRAPRAELLPESYKHMENVPLWHFTDGSRSASSTVAGQHRLDSCDTLFNEGLNELLQTTATLPEGSGIGCTTDIAARVLSEVHRTIVDRQLLPGVPRAPPGTAATTTKTKADRAKQPRDAAATKQTSAQKKRNDNTNNEKPTRARPKKSETNGVNDGIRGSEVIEIS